MKMSYFDDTDTLYIEFRAAEVVETRDLYENTLLELDAKGQIIAITLEHASNRTDLDELTVSGLAA